MPQPILAAVPSKATARPSVIAQSSNTRLRIFKVRLGPAAGTGQSGDRVVDRAVSAREKKHSTTKLTKGTKDNTKKERIALRAQR
jgi:hypothetical protein